MKIVFYLLTSVLLINLSASATPKPSSAGKVPQTEKSISLVFFVDSSLLQRYPTAWRNRVKQLCVTASACFAQQFAVRLDIAKLIIVKMQRDTTITVDVAFNTLVGNAYPAGDTVSILLYADTTIDSQATLGETEIGRKQIVLREIISPDSLDIQSWAARQALTLLHELGHSFGAMHASDANSVMNHSPSPVGAYTYDPVNTQIIAQALQGDFAFINHEKFITTISWILQNTNYYLADYPEFFQHYLINDSIPVSLRQAMRHDSFLTAALAFNALSKNDSTIAHKLFDDAIATDSSMAVLWYYRGLATSDISESNRYLTHAAEAGYYLAQELLYIRQKAGSR